MTATEERKARKKLNNYLHDLGLNKTHDGICVDRIDDYLQSCGFNETEPAIYCGHQGMCHQQVGERTWLTFTWHKYESGRYEVITYAS